MKDEPSSSFILHPSSFILHPFFGALCMSDSPPEDMNPLPPAPHPNDQPTMADMRRENPLAKENFPGDVHNSPTDPGWPGGHRPDSITPPPPLERLGNYELISEIGRGGMGVIYKAQHTTLRRVVALKMILGGLLARPEDLHRFHTEAEAAAQLQHSGIVALYEVGTHEGQPYFSMEYVTGTSLAQLAAAGPLPGLRAARYLELTARAVHYAHSRGILHRDLKPANVLVDLQDQPKITDFGLAKLLQTDSGQTRTGVIIGTPSYMAPEQAAARKDLGPECDVYSLGAILYELLTGRPPFRGETALATLSLVTEQEPVPPRLLNPKVDLDLETICLKCLEKAPARRYGSAAALAEDLARYQAGEPILARRVGRLGRVVKWCRRKPAAAGLLAVSALAILALVVGGFLFGVVQHDLRQEAERQHEQAIRARRRAESSAEGMRRLLYLAQFHLAHHAWESADLDRAEDLLANWYPQPNRPDQPDLRSWEWYYLAGLCRGKYTLRGHKGRVTALAWRPDGRRLATAGDDLRIHIWDPATGKLMLSLEKVNEKPITCLAYSPRTSLLASASADHTVKIWNPQTGKKIHTLARHKDHVTSVSFSPDGRRLASSSGDHTVMLWNVDTGSLLRTLTDHNAPVSQVLFSPDEKILASAAEDGAVMLWSVVQEKLLATLPGHPYPVLSLAFSHDGKILASGGGWSGLHGEVRMWDVPKQRELRPLYRHADRVLSLAFNRQGKLAVAGRGGLVRVWNTTTGSEAFSFKGDTQNVYALAFSPSGERLAAAGQMGAVRLWNTRGGPGETRVPGRVDDTSRLVAVALSQDRQFLAAGGGVAGRFGEVKVWQAAGFRRYFLIKGHTDIVRSVAFSPSRSHIASAGDDKTLRVYDFQTRRLIYLCPHSSAVTVIAYSPDGKTLATAGFDDRIFLWDALKGTAKGVLRGHNNYILTLAFSPDGRRLASGGYDRTIKVWDLAAGKELFTLSERRPGGPGRFAVTALAFSPAGSELVSGSTDKTLRVWDLRSQKEMMKLEGSAGRVTAVAYTADGLRIICAGDDKMIRFWDVVTHQEILTLEGSVGPIKCMALSHDNRRLACVDNSRAVHVWETEKGED
jgi:WD40 repeat protein